MVFLRLNKRRHSKGDLFSGRPSWVRPCRLRLILGMTSSFLSTTISAQTRTSSFIGLHYFWKTRIDPSTRSCLACGWFTLDTLREPSAKGKSRRLAPYQTFKLDHLTISNYGLAAFSAREKLIEFLLFPKISLKFLSDNWSRAESAEVLFGREEP